MGDKRAIDPARDPSDGGRIFVGVTDTREKPGQRYVWTGVPMVVECLTTGDYSYRSGETRAAIERKAIDDLVGCLTADNRRFQEQLRRLSDLDFAAVVVEANLSDLAAHRYFAPKITPARVLDTIATLSIKYPRCPFLFGGAALHASALTMRLLRAHWLRGRREALEASTSALVAGLTKGDSP